MEMLTRTSSFSWKNLTLSSARTLGTKIVESEILIDSREFDERERMCDSESNSMVWIRPPPPRLRGKTKVLASNTSKRLRVVMLNSSSHICFENLVDRTSVEMEREVRLDMEQIDVMRVNRGSDVVSKR